jgi:Domain of unknown function (DUF4174)
MKGNLMKPLYAFVLATFLPFAVQAEDPYAPIMASEIVLAEQLYLTRPIVVFADSPNDPSYIRQMELLAKAYPELAARDVVIVTDTDPLALSEWRQKLRPRGFSMVLLDKDLKPVIRKPIPWDVREITHAIDKLPSRREELLDAAGR